jgi:phosphoribosyl 1,2-cyclic phosphate phosphodiesterase
MIGCQCEVCTSTDPRDTRLRCSAYITTDQGDSFLIDCGPDFRRQALDYHIHHIDAVLISHAHFDHVGGIDELRQINYLMKDSIPVYGTPPHIDEIRERVSYLFRDTQKGGGKARIDLYYMQKNETILIGNTPVLPLDVRHGVLEILGFRIGDLVYITDASQIPDTSFKLITQPRPRILILNALRYKEHQTHFNLEQAVSEAQNIGAEQTWFIHMTHDILHQAADSQLPDNIRLAFDGLSLDFHS